MQFLHRGLFLFLLFEKTSGGMKMGVYEELIERGLIAQVTNEEEIREMIK